MAALDEYFDYVLDMKAKCYRPKSFRSWYRDNYEVLDNLDIINKIVRCSLNYRLFSEHIVIMSSIGEWLVRKEDLSKDTIKLMHKNYNVSYGSLNAYHFQKNFETFDELLKYIKVHDKV